MKFSLVIPLAPERNAEILESIKEISYPKSEFHVIVIRGKNPSENRNKGAEKSKGEIIAFLDDDAIVEKNLLKKAEEFFENNPNIDVVGGPQLSPFDDSGFARISGYALSSQFGAWKMVNRYSVKKEILNADETYLTSANLFCRKKVIEKIKFDSNLFPGEDPKFIEDAKKAGFKIAYSPDLIIYHRRRPTISGLARQIFNYGKVRPLKESFFQTLKMPFFLIPSLFLIYLIVLFSLVIINPSITGQAVSIGEVTIKGYSTSFLIIVLPLTLYILLCGGFSIYNSLNNRDYRAILVLPFIYPLIHLSYGAGMVYGYFKKLKL